MFDEEDEPGGCAGNIDETITEDFSEPLDELYNFLRKDKDAVLTFIGGEPLMNPELIMEVMDNAPVKRFMIQTNGTLLADFPAEYTNRFETILISVDGKKSLTDKHRGSGIYDKVMSVSKHIVDNGFKGELIARMTAAEDTDIFESVTHLSNYFSSIHWQIDADFTGDFSKRHFAEWSRSYNEGIIRLVKEWTDRIESTGIVPKWYPFLSTTEDLLTGKPSRLRCGSGYANYSIMTNGFIAPCPIMVGMSDYYAGHIKDSDPNKLPEILVGEPCTSCRIYSFCGGRCLYSNIIRPWKDSYKLVCGTVFALHDALTENLPRVRKLIDEGIISMDSFKHTRYNGCEIIP